MMVSESPSTPPPADPPAAPPPTAEGASARPWWRPSKRWLVVLGLLMVAVGVFGSWVLATRGGNAFLLRQVALRVEKASGWWLEAEYVELRPWRGLLKLEGIELGARDSEPFVAVQQLRAEVDPRQVLSGEVRISDLELIGPRVNLRAPLPTPPEPVDEQATPSDPASVPDVLAWRIENGAVRGTETEGWLETWGASGFRAEGSLVDGALELSISEGAVVLEKRDARESPGPGASELTLATRAKARGPLFGPYSLDHLEVSGDGIEARARATIEPRDEGPIRLAFDADVDPQKLLPPEVVAGGGLDGDGSTPSLAISAELDVRRLVGHFEVRGPDLPVALFEPLLGGATIDRLGARGSRLDLDGRLDLAGAEQAAGDLSMVWRRQGEALLEASARLSDTPNATTPSTTAPSTATPSTATPGASPGDPLAIAFEASLLPEVPGTRHLEGQVLVPVDQASGELRADGASWDGTRARVEDDAHRLLGEFGKRWPELVAELPGVMEELLRPEIVGEAAPLELSVELEGALADPSVEGTLRLGAAESALGSESPLALEIRGEGRPMAGIPGVEVDSSVHIRGLELAALGPVLREALPPSATLDGRLSGRIDGHSGRLDPGSTGRQGSGVELEAHLEGQRLAVVLPSEAPESVREPASGGTEASAPLEAKIESWQLRASGALPLSAEAEPDVAAARFTVESFHADQLDLPGLEDTPFSGIRSLDSRVVMADRELVLHALSLVMEPKEPERQAAMGVRLEGRAALATTFESGLLPADWQGRLTVDSPTTRIDRLETEFSLAKGALRAELVGLDWVDAEPSDGSSPTASAGREAFSAFLPVGSLVALPEIGPALDALPWAERAEGLVNVSFDLPSLDSRGLAPLLDLDDSWRFRGAASGSLELDPSRPTAATGRLFLPHARLALGERMVEALGRLDISISGHRVEIGPVTCQVDDHLVELGGTIELRPGWIFGRSMTEALTSIDVSGRGTAAVDVFAPYLAGGVPEGTVDIEMKLGGPLDALEGLIEIDGETAGITWPVPYATRLESPTARLRFADSALTIESMSADWNDGSLELEGLIGLGAEGEEGAASETEIRGYFDSVRYRLDYGLTTLSSGNFTFRPEPAELQVALLVERGFLRRNIAAGREIMGQLLAPPALDVPVDATLADTRLSIDVATVDGVRVKNNLADLHASWSPIRVEGTLGRPRVRGSIEATPGGRLYAYGQVLRLDRAVLELSGDPSVPSRIDLETTSSIEDPTIATPDDQQLMAAMAGMGGGLDTSNLSEEERKAELERQLASGLGTYYGNQLASRLSRSLSGTRLSYQPLWIYGESDTDARLVISQELSRYLTLAVALDLDQAERQTYLLDLHGLRSLPSFSATVFTSDESDYGATLQQQLLLGGEPAESQWPLLRKIEVSCPECDCQGCPSTRRLRLMADYEKGDRLPDGSDFAIEIDMQEGLAQAGYPDARVRARIRPVTDDADYADVVAEVSRLGEALEVEFVGEKPPRRYRREIRSLYRGGYYEPTSLIEIRESTERVWRSQGHMEPKVEVTLERSSTAGTGSADGAAGGRVTRLLRIHSEPGPEPKLPAPEIVGVDDLEALVLVQQRLASTQARVELAMALPEGDRRILDTLASLGYRDPRLVGRELDLEAGVFRVEVDPGFRPVLAAVEVAGLPGELSAAEEEELRASLGLAAGAPAIPGSIGGAGLRLEQALRGKGYADARVRPVVPEGEATGAGGPTVRFLVEAGVQQRLRTVEIVGAHHTGSNWAKRKAELEVGELLDTGKVAEGRRRLLESRLFEAVRVTTEADELGDAVVTFDLQERPRYSLAYGLRWESEGGIGGVFDVLDRNVTGRGIGLGLRALWLSDRRSSRVYSVLPKVLGSSADVELFLEGFRGEEDALREEGLTFSGQVSFPLGQRLRGRAYARYRTVEETDLDVEVGALDTTETSTPVLGFQLIYDLRDDPIDSSRGVFTSLDVSTSPRLDQGDDEYFDRAFGRLSYYLPLSGNRLVWAQSIRLGLAEVGGDLPREFRFFAGGQYSVRGYPSRSLGPREELSDGSFRELGGEATAVFNQELRLRVNDSLQTLIFLDAGQVWEKLEDARVGDLRQGVGIGLRYRSPVGLIRLDLAHPLDARSDDEDLAVYFGFGQAF